MTGRAPYVRCRECGTLLGARNQTGICTACHEANERMDDGTDFGPAPAEAQSATERIYRAGDPYERRPWWEDQ